MFELKDIYDYFNQEYRFKENIVFDGASIDTRTIRNNELFFAIKGKNFDGNEYVDVAFDKGALGAITNKNVVTKKDKVFIKKVDNVLSELHNFAAYIRKKYDFKVVAVTGSAGKTTTKDMIAHILGKHYNVKKSHKSFNNDYGVPLTLLGMEKNDTHLILEIGANHIGEVEKLSKIASPDIAVITNIGYAHIGEFGSKDNILEAKSEIIQNINTNGIAIINGDDIKLREKVYSYSETKNINDFSSSCYGIRY
jgi:UDP-N-acetylmuramoyl-tripeptide--D-alanyl-D-alanine ligase